MPIFIANLGGFMVHTAVCGLVVYMYPRNNIFEKINQNSTRISFGVQAFDIAGRAPLYSIFLCYVNAKNYLLTKCRQYCICMNVFNPFNQVYPSCSVLFWKIFGHIAEVLSFIILDKAVFITIKAYKQHFYKDQLTPSE